MKREGKQARRANKQPKPRAEKSKERTATSEKAFTFIPAVGIYEPARQYTRDGWERVSR